MDNLATLETFVPNTQDKDKQSNTQHRKLTKRLATLTPTKPSVNSSARGE